MKRTRLVKSRVLPEMREEYLKMHNEQNLEIRKEFERLGTNKVVCFLDGCDLFVYAEYDDESVENEETAPELTKFVKECGAKCKDKTVTPKELEIVYYHEVK